MLIVTMVRESALVENVTANQAGSCMTALVIFSATFIYIVLDSSREKTFLDLIFQPQFFLKNTQPSFILLSKDQLRIVNVL